MRALLDRPYPVTGGTGYYDLFLPDGAADRPLLVFLHGGGWVSGSKEDYREEALWAASQGFRCACVGYRLAPLHPFPTPVADVQRFFLHARRAEFEAALRVGRVLAVGNSAGGHLALMAGLCPRVLDGDGEQASRADATVAVCPITDLRKPTSTHFPVAHAFLEQFVGRPLAEAAALLEAASPIVYVDHAAGPVTLLHGTEDEIVPFDQSVRLALALERAGKRVAFSPLMGEAHSFSYGAWEDVRAAYVEAALALGDSS